MYIVIAIGNYQTFNGGHFGLRHIDMVTTVACDIFEACMFEGEDLVKCIDKSIAVPKTIDTSTMLQADVHGDVLSNSKERDVDQLFDADEVMKLQELTLASMESFNITNQTHCTTATATANGPSSPSTSSMENHATDSTPTTPLKAFGGFTVLSPVFGRGLDSAYSALHSPTTGMRKSISHQQLASCHVLRNENEGFAGMPRSRSLSNMKNISGT